VQSSMCAVLAGLDQSNRDQQLAVAFADEQQATSSPQTQQATDATRPSSSGRKSAHQVAAEHQQEVAILQELLKKQGLSTLPLRLNSGDAELIRYCLLHANVASMFETLAVLSSN
jgi:hypothetical protein